jgi:hypothetical protein
MLAPGRTARTAPVALVALLAEIIALAALPASVRGDVVLHEYIPSDPADDLRLGATTGDGEMAAAIQTQSGPVASPDLEKRSEHRGSVYGSERNPPGSGLTFRIDGDTTRPDQVSYDDPFTPAIAPYKREFAYDAVDERLDLAVQGAALTALSVGGSPRPEDDQFFADLDVDLTAGQAVRIPTVGPSARVLAMRLSPEAGVVLLHDSADNWFARGDRDGPVRLVLHLAIDRAVYGSPFADVEWNRLARLVPPLPDAVRNEGIRMARQIGVVDGTGPAEALRILVKYFRAFTPSSERLKSSAGVDLYRELSLSQKGVCRHRSYAFVVTALGLGFPARFVRNEAHAWVEVSDGTRFHRIDLGGAASELSLSDASRVPHVPPLDPFQWPQAVDSGQVAADRSRTATAPGRSGARTSARQSLASAAPTPSAGLPSDPEDQRPRPTITLKLGGPEARRGSRLGISGRIESASGPCGAVRVDLFLEPTTGTSRERVPLGTLVTNDGGRYEGYIVVPFVVPPGDYDVRASTPGNLACGEGQSP